VTPLFHIAQGSDWRDASAAGTYAPASIATEGFIHLSTPAQVLGTLTRFYADTTDLMLLVLDGDRLGDALRWDDVEHEDGSSATFPHLYRALDPAEAVETLIAPSADELATLIDAYIAREGLLDR
jgi:uncharacterized protein (DUF952 family)